MCRSPGCVLDPSSVLKLEVVLGHRTAVALCCSGMVSLQRTNVKSQCQNKCLCRNWPAGQLQTMKRRKTNISWTWQPWRWWRWSSSCSMGQREKARDLRCFRCWLWWLSLFITLRCWETAFRWDERLAPGRRTRDVKLQNSGSGSPTAEAGWSPLCCLVVWWCLFV